MHLNSTEAKMFFKNFAVTRRSVRKVDDCIAQRTNRNRKTGIQNTLKKRSKHKQLY